MTFRHVRTMPYPDKKCQLIEYIHDESGLRHMHLDSSYPELSLVVAVPTPPPDNTGMPHILEHMAMSGGAKYPVHDALMSMMQRSVAHDMNAMTSALFTAYHFSTTLPADFENLSDVYLDLVFTPLLRKSDFDKEGWRVERNVDGQAELKGVVFNEMKGAYANPAMRQREALADALAPGSAWAKSSGGHPAAIPSLTHERLKAFYAKQYHPKGAVMVTTGAVPLDVLHQQWESVWERRTQMWPDHQGPLPAAGPTAHHRDAIISHPDHEGHVHARMPGSIDTPSSIMWSKTASAPQTPRDELWDQMMTAAVFSSPNSPLKLAQDRIGSGRLGASYVTNPLTHATGQVAVLISVSGADSAHIQAWDEAVAAAWLHAKNHGIHPDDWRSVVSQFTKMVTDQVDESPLNTAIEIASEAVWGVDPSRNNHNVNLLAEWADGANTPTDSDVATWCQRFSATAPVVHITPDDQLLQHWSDLEAIRLAELAPTALPPVPLAAPESPDCLPGLTASDLTTPPLRLFHGQPVTSHVNACARTHWSANTASSGIEIIWDMADLSPHDAMVWNLWSALSKDMGTADNRATPQKSWENRHGVDVAWNLSMERHWFNPSQTGQLLSCQADSLSANVAAAAQTLLDRTGGPPQIEADIWSASCSRMRQSLKRGRAERDHARAQNITKAPFSASRALWVQQDAYASLHQDAWLAHAASDPAWLASEWKRLWKQLDKAPRHVVSWGLDDASSGSIRVARAWAGGAPWNTLSDWTPSPASSMPTGVYPIASPVMVNHCLTSQPGPALDDPSYMATKVALSALDPILHEQVREEGGAYGVQASCSSGVIQWSSFRDPHVERTFSIFSSVQAEHQSPDAWSDDMVARAKIDVFKVFARPSSDSDAVHDAIAYARMGAPVNANSQLLTALTAVTTDDVRAAAAKWLTPSATHRCWIHPEETPSPAPSQSSEHPLDRTLKA